MTTGASITKKFVDEFLQGFRTYTKPHHRYDPDILGAFDGVAWSPKKTILFQVTTEKHKYEHLPSFNGINLADFPPGTEKWLVLLWDRGKKKGEWMIQKEGGENAKKEAGSAMNCPHCGKELPSELVKTARQYHTLLVEEYGECGYIADGKKCPFGCVAEGMKP